MSDEQNIGSVEANPVVKAVEEQAQVAETRVTEITARLVVVARTLLRLADERGLKGTPEYENAVQAIKDAGYEP
jgi:hypothetical protein